jgi:hypothetical protein
VALAEGSHSACTKAGHVDMSLNKQRSLSVNGKQTWTNSRASVCGEMNHPIQHVRFPNPYTTMTPENCNKAKHLGLQQKRDTNTTIAECLAVSKLKKTQNGKRSWYSLSKNRYNVAFSGSLGSRLLHKPGERTVQIMFGWTIDWNVDGAKLTTSFFLNRLLNISKWCTSSLSQLQLELQTLSTRSYQVTGAVGLRNPFVASSSACGVCLDSLGICKRC